MVLRLEHIHDVRAERLRGLHHVRAGRVALAGRLKRGSGSQDGDAGLQESIDELGGVCEIRLVRRNDVTARIAHFGIVQDGVVKLHGNRAAARRAASRRFERGNALGRDVQ